MHAFLHQPIGIGDALVLAQMLHPGFHQECLDHPALLGRIFEYTPRIGAVATPFVLERYERFEKRLAVPWINAIFDGDQDRAAVVLDRLRGQRRRPVHRRRQIDRRPCLQFPRPGQRNGGDGTRAGEKVRVRQTNRGGDFAPGCAAQRKAAEENGGVKR